MLGPACNPHATEATSPEAAVKAATNVGAQDLPFSSKTIGLYPSGSQLLLGQRSLSTILLFRVMTESAKSFLQRRSQRPVSVRRRVHRAAEQRCASAYTCPRRGYDGKGGTSKTPMAYRRPSRSIEPGGDPGFGVVVTRALRKEWSAASRAGGTVRESTKAGVFQGSRCRRLHAR